MTCVSLSYRTQSLCPVCLARIEARHVADNDRIYLEKTCTVHGLFRARIWEGQESYARWVRPKIPIKKRFSMTEVRHGCPFDCGLCPDHLQHTCTAVLDVTSRCNLSCRFCFADAGNGPGKDPDLARLRTLMQGVFKVSPGCNLQISGGEPTMREDLPDIVAQARRIGFAFVQLNTNGIRLARDTSLARHLGEAGLASVFLQFDGVSDGVYRTLRGRALMEEKRAAIEACGQNGIGVILVPTLVPGVNVDEIGDILRFALDRRPVVRGVHFQPVSYFGRHGSGRAPEDGERITIPEVLTEVVAQTGGLFRADDFKPSSCEHALCAFTGKFRVQGGVPRALTCFDTACCAPVPAEQGAKKAKASVARHWRVPRGQAVAPGSREPLDGLDRFIRQAEQEMFTVSGMAFQDVWNLDLNRLRGCCIHAVSPDGRLIPFCAYNLTDAVGKGLYRNP